VQFCAARTFRFGFVMSPGSVHRQSFCLLGMLIIGSNVIALSTIGNDIDDRMTVNEKLPSEMGDKTRLYSEKFSRSVAKPRVKSKGKFSNKPLLAAEKRQGSTDTTPSSRVNRPFRSNAYDSSEDPDSKYEHLPTAATSIRSPDKTPSSRSADVSNVEGESSRYDVHSTEQIMKWSEEICETVIAARRRRISLRNTD
jgi:hypothetical protein